MVTETALSRERAKRCEWCAKGIPREIPYSYITFYHIKVGNGKYQTECTGSGRTLREAIRAAREKEKA